MGPHQPGRHPVLMGRQVGDSGIDMVPPELAAASAPERGLCVGIELPQIVERGCRVDRVEQFGRRVDRILEHFLRSPPRASANRLDVTCVRIAIRPFARR